MKHFGLHRPFACLLLSPLFLLAQTPPVLHAFGDSITIGGKASDFATKSYIALTSSAQGWPLINTAHPGDQAADAAILIYGETAHPHALYTLQIGVNDEWIYGTDPARLNIFAAAHMAELAWLSLPGAQKITAHSPAVTYSGAWTDSSLYPGLGMQSSQPGSKASFTISGSTLLAGISLSDRKSGCQISLSIDGITFGSWSFLATAPIKTYLGTDFAPYLIRASNLSPGPHRADLFVVSCNSPTSAAFFDWAAGVGPGSGVSAPPLYVLNVPRKSASFYAQYPGGSDANVFAYNQAIAQNVNTLRQDGLPVHLVDIWSILDTINDLDIDGIHPNDTGHALISQALLGAIGNSSPAPGVPVSPAPVKLGPRESAQFLTSDSISYLWTTSRAIGSLRPGGKYTAPVTLPDTPPAIEIIATNPANAAQSGSSLISFQHGLIAGPVYPSLGAGASAVFQFDVSNSLNTKTLNTASILISNNGVTALNMCFVKWDRSTNLFNLGNDNPAGPAYPSNALFWAGAAAPGSTTAVANSQCTLLPAQSAATPDPSGTVMHIALAFQFPNSWAGDKIVYLSADDTLNQDTNWNPAGTWTVTTSP